MWRQALLLLIGVAAFAEAGEIDPSWLTDARVAKSYEYVTNKPVGRKSCFTNEIFAEHNIKPADRSEMTKPFRIAWRNWASHTYLADMAHILLEETMGYYVTLSKGAADVHWKFMDRVNLSDLDLESWLPSGAGVLKRLTIDTDTCQNYGSVGFDGLEGFYAPTYMADKEWQVAQADKPWAGLDQINGFYPFYWESFNNPDVVEILSKVNYKTMLEENMAYFNSTGTKMHKLLNVDGWKWPYRTDADAWDQVFVNDDLCDVDAAIPSAQAGDCMTFLGGSSDWAHGYMQSMMRQRELKINIEFVGYYGMMALVPYLIELEMPMYFFWWTPDSFLAPFGSSVTRVTLPTKDDTTFSNTNERLDGKGSSYNADLLSVFVSKIARTSAVEDDVAMDIIGFLQRFVVDNVRIMDMLSDQADLGTPQWESACQYLHDHPEFWTPLVQNHYKPPRLLTVHTTRPAYLALLVTMVIVVTVVNILACKWSAKRIVRLSSYRISGITSIGICLTTGSLYYWTLDGGEEGVTQEQLDHACTVRVWLLSLGVTLFFAPIAAKLYRVKKIFNTNSTLNAMKVTDTLLFLYIFALVVFVSLYVGVWTAVQTPTWETITETGEPDADRAQYGYCVYETYGNLIAYVLILIPIIVCAQWAWDTRNVVVQAVNDSKQVAVTMGCFTFFTLIQIVLLLFVTDPRIVLTLWMVQVSCVGFISILLIYGPMFYAIITGTEETMTNTNASKVHSVVVSSVGASAVGSSTIEC